ncbi:MAG: family 43 glycosylhydrolase [Bacteroidota bacterium]
MILQTNFSHKTSRKGFIFSLFLLIMSGLLYAQPGIHDPSTTVRNTDGRYWHFATGNGIYTISSTTTNFSSWQTQNTVFPIGTWPSWIGNYVSGFAGNFWAPEVVKIGSTYYCYYSCAGNGAAAAIGLATATNLNGPWTDKGMIVAANNAIDPSVIVDGSTMYMAYGNWQSGIDLIQLNPSTGLRQGTSRWDIVAGQVEAPYIMKHNSYYYMFFQRGLCCNGVNSGYYTQVGRATSITGPYVDQNGISLMSDGGTTFLPNKNGNVIGPGHVGYGESTLSYHFYDGNDNGAPKLKTTTLGWSNDWPVAGTASPIVLNGTYRLVNKASGKYLDNLGATANGANAVQWANSPNFNQRWVITYAGSGFYKLKGVTGGLYLDSVGATADGSVVGQWANGSSTNQQWSIVAAGPYYKLVNRANGKAVDTGGLTADGSVLQHWYSNASNNQQWTLEYVSGATSRIGNFDEEIVENEPAEGKFYATPNPVNGNTIEVFAHNAARTDVNIAIINLAGQVLYSEHVGIKDAGDFSHTIDVSKLPVGVYFVNMGTGEGFTSTKLIRN